MFFVLATWPEYSDAYLINLRNFPSVQFSSVANVDLKPKMFLLKKINKKKNSEMKKIVINTLNN